MSLTEHDPAGGALEYAGTHYRAEPGETVLQILERHGVAVPSGCRAGLCQSCKLQATAGTPPPPAIEPLSPKDQLDGFFLACQSPAVPGLSIRPVGGTPEQETGACPATVVETSELSPSVRRLVVRPEQPFVFRAGQFVTLSREDGLGRCYSIASASASTGAIEFHIRRIRGGAFSPWLHDACLPGTRLTLSPAQGNCVYAPAHDGEPLLLVGTGTGLAPLLGILQDALAAGHRGPIHLFHEASKARGLYLRNELTDLAAAHDGLHYTACVRKDTPLDAEKDLLPDQAPIRAPAPLLGGLETVVRQSGLDLAPCRLFLCGNGDAVRELQKKFFLAGARLGAIFVDAFTG